MKRFLISTAIAIAMSSAAYAHPVTVIAPKAPVSQAEADAYVAELDHAVRKVCASAFSPIVGLAFYSYQACLKSTRAEVEKKDPTGLYAARESATKTTLASR